MLMMASLLLALTAVLGELAQDGYRNMEVQQCGSNLADIFDVICNRRINEHNNRRLFRNRSAQDLSLGEETLYTADNGGSMSAAEVPYLPLRKRHPLPESLGYFQRRARPGIVDECCHRPCTIGYIEQNYCEPPRP